jgi:hypothetical protein
VTRFVKIIDLPYYPASYSEAERWINPDQVAHLREDGEGYTSIEMTSGSRFSVRSTVADTIRLLSS